jgi:PTS system glucose-specific IIC component
MIPLSFTFLLLWPYIGFGMAWFGNNSGKLPAGLDSFAFGYIERALIPFGLHHVFYAPLWWTSAGGSFTPAFET